MGRAKGQRVIQLRLPSCLALLRPGIDQIEADPFESILSRFQRSQSFLYVMRPAHKAQRCIVEFLQTQGHAVHASRCEICESRRLYRGGIGFQRSEEHTSELQSLMRISNAVFCLKKQKHTTNIQSR